MHSHGKEERYIDYCAIAPTEIAKEVEHKQQHPLNYLLWEYLIIRMVT